MIYVQRAVSARGLPSAGSLKIFAQAALPRAHGAVTLRVVDEAESHALNHRYRGKDKSTNVLSFPSSISHLPSSVLGDLVLCAPVIAREAQEQGKLLRAHWAHMVVHGCLHLRGHDHEDDAEARRMESYEIKILRGLGFKDPYQ